MAEWWAWRQDVFGDPYLVWHDGVDFQVLTERAQTESDEVAKMLALGLAAGDYVAAQSYGHLSSAGLAPNNTETLLRSAAAAAEGKFLVTIAEALHVVTADASWGDTIAHVLAYPDETSSYTAAIALRVFTPTPHLVNALLTAVTTGPYLTRYHSANTLLAYAGDKRDVSSIPEIFTNMTSDNDPQAFAAAADQLRKQVAQIIDER